jgi:dihydroorotase
VNTTPDRLTLRAPDDWHAHLRDGAMLGPVAEYTARCFARAIVMPNLVPPVTTVAAARDYRARILAALDDPAAFEPLMTCYLTDDCDADALEAAHRDGVFVAAKLYPANATTNSQFGVGDIARIRPVLERMQRISMPLLVHGEVTDPAVDIFDREAVFIERVLAPLLDDLPALKVVFEHVTTLEAVDFVAESGANVAATITPHHLMINRNALFDGGMRPHMFCLPVAKRERHRLSLRAAAISGDASFFLGTDSAPHAIAAKQADCGCAGIFNAPTALECYAQVFDEENALDRLQGFASENGARFYGLPLNDGEITLIRNSWNVPETIALPAPDDAVVPFRAGATLDWRIVPPVRA